MLSTIVNVSHLLQAAGYPLLFLLVMAESAGVPLPGETALITGAALASEGQLSIELVVTIAAAGAIVGDNIGYVIGKRGGRWLLQRPGLLHRHRLEVLAIGEPFFERHGPKAVFFGRLILGLRTWASWLAGATKMRWRSFALWNAIGGICWATGVGTAAYFIGRSAEHALELFGLYGLIAFAIAVSTLLVLRRRHKRLLRAATPVGDQRGEEPEQAAHTKGRGPAGPLLSIPGPPDLSGERGPWDSV